MALPYIQIYGHGNFHYILVCLASHRERGLLQRVAWRARGPFLVPVWRAAAEGDQQKDNSTKLKTPSSVEELRTFAELRAVRGFYPRVQLVAPDTLALMQAAAASTVAGASNISLDMVLDNMKAGTTARMDIFGSYSLIANV